MSRKTVSMIGNLTRDMMSDVMETSLKKPIQTGEFRKNPVEPAWRCPAEYIYELVKTEQFVMEYLKPKQAVTGRVILQLHGGGYIGPMKNIYRRFAVKYSQISFGADVLTPDYRVAPEHPYPAALEDAVYAYRWLLEEKKYQPSQIVVAGDSAGGGLALALCLYAKDHGLPLPAGIITMSPWTDVSLSGASYEENYTIDPLFGNSKENMLYQCSYIGNANPKNPYLSPLFGDFEGFPPMLMQVGAYEVLLDDTRAAAKKARAEGVKVHCSVYDGMFHVFQMGLDLIPESREAWEEVAEYLRIICCILHDSLLIQFFSSEHSRHFSRLDDTYVIAHIDDLRQLAGYHDNGDTRLRQLINNGINLKLRIDIDASRRLVQNQDIRLDCQPFSKDNLLLVSAGKTSRFHQFHPVCHCFDMKLFFIIINHFLTFPVADGNSVNIRVNRRQREVKTDRIAKDKSLFFPILRHQSDARLDCLNRCREADFLSI